MDGNTFLLVRMAKLYVPVGLLAIFVNQKIPSLIASPGWISKLKMEIVQKGVRNTVGFTWSPENKQLGLRTMVGIGLEKINLHADEPCR